MRTVIKLFFAILIITQTATITHSQDNGNIKKSDKQIFILGKKYYLHKVKRGQTLYSLSNAYKVSIQEIISENSVLLSGRLKSGMELKIPVAEKVAEVKGNNNNDGFIYHTVQPKQTLYFIKNKYQVSEEDILKHNPQISGGIIKLGEVLKIPKIGNQSNTSESAYYFHEVKPGETLFSLSQQYRVSIAIINSLNPETAQGNLKIGQTLKIPKHNYSSSETLVIDHNYSENKNYDYDPLYFEEAGTIPCNEFRYNRFVKFKIALMLPLFIEENNSLLATSGRYYKDTEKFYELYQGFLIAVDRLKKTGVSVELFVYDTKKSLSKVQGILNKSELANVDLIIGPVYSDNFKLAANFAQLHKINIVSPVPQTSSSLVRTNPFIFMTNPSIDVKVANISKYLANSYDRSIVVIHNGTSQEGKIIELLKSHLVKSFASYQNINEVVFKQVNYKISGINGVMDALSVGLDNIVLIPSNDEAFITDIVTRLNFNKNRYKVTVYGMKSWESFRNIQIEYLANLNCHYGTTSYIDYNNKSIKNFLYQYKNTFSAEPGLYSFLGYDISYYFLNVMKKYGKHFQFCLPADMAMQKMGLMYSFNFQRISPSSGFENNWLGIIKIDKNYKLIRVK